MSQHEEQSVTAEYFDVVIVGAGLSGIGAAYHLQDKCPNKRYVILEGRDSMGGTWDLFRYPGIRSDSDMHTLGYNFKPWNAAKAIADGPAILEYVKETAAENDIDRHIRYRHLVKKASWSSSDATWTIEIQRKDTGETVFISCNFVMMCSGYYSYEEGYTPEFRGRERFRGDIIHPQEWPEDLDYRGKKVVVIGSGATAVTLIPAMAEDAAHVVMVQRSPSYVVSRPAKDVIANVLRKILPNRIAYAITRWKNIRWQQAVYRKTRTDPEKVKNMLLKWVRKELGPDYDVDTHFTPRYNPWDQRLCLVPDSDLFHSIRSGKASVVTDHIDTFTEQGLLLKSGKELEADIIVTATGLKLVLLGGTELEVDGQPVRFPEKFSYKGMMYSDVPNLITTFGYINASWTLRADLIAEYACRLINHMDQTGNRQCMPQVPDKDKDMPALDWISSFSSGYMQRMMDKFPKQGDRHPWMNTQNYEQDKMLTLRDPIDDGVMVFSNPASENEGTDSAHWESDAA
jgi:cation diffusion facilitator CzcD-associated flavoprotein CzcO